MLFFSDKPKQIRVLRVSSETGRAVRTPVGVVSKANFGVSDELRAALSPEELLEVGAMIAAHQAGEQARLKSAALNFAATAREAMDYFEASANETEKAIIASGLVEAIRRLRKNEREAGVDL